MAVTSAAEGAVHDANTAETAVTSLCKHGTSLVGQLTCSKAAAPPALPLLTIKSQNMAVGNNPHMLRVHIAQFRTLPQKICERPRSSTTQRHTAHNFKKLLPTLLAQHALAAGRGCQSGQLAAATHSLAAASGCQLRHDKYRPPHFTRCSKL